MIKVTDVAGNDKYINCDLIERIEANPDTVLFLVNGHNLILRDKPDEIVEKIVSFRRRCLEGANVSQVPLPGASQAQPGKQS